MTGNGRRRRERQRSAQRLTLWFCMATLVAAAACAVWHFSPAWIALPVLAAVASACFMSVSDIVGMLFGHRD